MIVAAPTGMPAGVPIACAPACTAPTPAPLPQSPLPVPAGGAAAFVTPVQLPVPLVGGATSASTLAAAGASALGAPPVALGANAAPTGARMTSLAPGALRSDADLVERTLAKLRTSSAGAQLVDRLLAVGARINVISDAEFAAMGQQSAHAFYDPALDTMYLRRSDLSDDRNIGFAALALAHEGTHLLDDVAGVTAPLAQQVTNAVVAAGGLQTAAGIEARDQGAFELTMVKEARAFLFAGQVARELGVSVDAGDPTAVAIAGSNDRATYARVWQRLLESSYNAQGRTAPVRYA